MAYLMLGKKREKISKGLCLLYWPYERAVNSESHNKTNAFLLKFNSNTPEYYVTIDYDT